MEEEFCRHCHYEGCGHCQLTGWQQTADKLRLVKFVDPKVALRQAIESMERYIKDRESRDQCKRVRKLVSS